MGLVSSVEDRMILLIFDWRKEVEGSELNVEGDMIYKVTIMDNNQRKPRITFFGTLKV